MINKNPKNSQVIDSIIEYIRNSDDFGTFKYYLLKTLKQIDSCSIKQKNYILKNISQLLTSRSILEKSYKNKDLVDLSIDFFNNSNFDSSIYFLMQKIYFNISRKNSIFNIEDIVDVCIKHNMLSDIASNLISILGIIGLKEKIKEVFNTVKDNQENISTFEENILNKNAHLYLNGSKSQMFVDYTENCRKLSPVLGDYATKYTYDLLLSEKNNELIDFVNENKFLINSLPDEDKAIIKINEYTAYKNLNGILDKEKTEFLNTIISKSYSLEISICAKSLKDDPQALTSLKQLIDIDFHFYYLIQEWPAINNSLKEQINKIYQESKLKAVS